MFLYRDLQITRFYFPKNYLHYGIFAKGIIFSLEVCSENTGYALPESSRECAPVLTDQVIGGIKRLPVDKLDKQPPLSYCHIPHIIFIFAENILFELSEILLPSLFVRDPLKFLIHSAQF